MKPPSLSNLSSFTKLKIVTGFLCILLIVIGALAYPNNVFLQPQPVYKPGDRDAPYILSTFPGCSELGDLYSAEVYHKQFSFQEALIQVFFSTQCGTWIGLKTRPLAFENQECFEWASGFVDSVTVPQSLNSPRRIQTVIDYNENRLFALGPKNSTFLQYMVVQFDENGFGLPLFSELDVVLGTNSWIQAIMFSQAQHSWSKMFYWSNDTAGILSSFAQRAEYDDNGDCSPQGVFVFQIFVTPTGLFNVTSQLSARLDEPSTDISNPEFPRCHYFIPITQDISPSQFFDNPQKFKLRMDAWIAETDLAQEPPSFSYTTIKDVDGSKMSPLELGADTNHDFYLKNPIPALYLSRPSPYDDKNLILFFKDLACSFDTGNCLNNDRNTQAEVENPNLMLLIDSEDYQVQNVRDPRFFESYDDTNRPAGVIHIFPFIYILDALYFPNPEEKQDIDKFFYDYGDIGIFLRAQTFQPFQSDPAQVANPWPLNDVRTDTITAATMRDRYMLNYQPATTVDKAEGHNIFSFAKEWIYGPPNQLILSPSCRDVFISSSFSPFTKEHSGPNWEPSSSQFSFSTSPKGAASSNSPIGFFLGLIWAWLLLATSVGVYLIMRLSSHLQSVLEPKITELWVALSSPLTRSNLFPIAILIIEYLQLSAFSLTPRIAWPANISWYTKTVGPIVLLDISAIVLSLVPPDINPRIISMVLFGLSCAFVFLFFIMYLAAVFKFFRGKTLKIRGLSKIIIALFPVITTLSFIPFLKATIYPASCTPISDPHNAVDTTMVISEIAFGDPLCFNSADYFIVMIIGLVMFTIYLPFAMSLQPLWQFLDDKQEVFYTPMALAAVSSMKLGVVLVSVFFSRFPIIIVVIQMILCLALALFFSITRPGSVWQVNNWRIGLLTACSWSGIAGIVAVTVDDETNPAPGIVFYVGTIFIMLATATITHLMPSRVPTGMKHHPLPTEFPLFHIPFLQRSDSAGFIHRIHDLLIWRFQVRKVRDREGSVSNDLVKTEQAKIMAKSEEDISFELEELK